MDFARAGGNPRPSTEPRPKGGRERKRDDGGERATERPTRDSRTSLRVLRREEGFGVSVKRLIIYDLRFSRSREREEGARKRKQWRGHGTVRTGRSISRSTYFRRRCSSLHPLSSLPASRAQPRPVFVPRPRVPFSRLSSYPFFPPLSLSLSLSSLVFQIPTSNSRNIVRILSSSTRERESLVRGAARTFGSLDRRKAALLYTLQNPIFERRGNRSFEEAERSITFELSLNYYASRFCTSRDRASRQPAAARLDSQNPQCPLPSN